MSRIFFIAYLFLFVFYFEKAIAKPFIPKDDSQVLEKLSSKPGIPISRELRRLRTELAHNPNNEELALNFAKHCIELGRVESDPRYFGYAERALQPFLKKASPKALVLKAIIKQSNHDFEGALEDLNKVLKVNNGNPQIWLTKAQILTTTGDYTEAKKSCIPLLHLTNELVSVSCISNAASLNGNGKKSYELLKKIIDNASYATKEEKLWALTILGDIARRIGDYKGAEGNYMQALKLGINDNYLLATYSDFLLDQKRPKELILLISNMTKVDSLLLRLALAEKLLNLPTLKQHIKELNERFWASRLRGDSIHLQEEAIFTLKLLNNPKKALELAKKNWVVQKEPTDAQILLESAIAANKKGSTKPVIDFIVKNKLEDVQLSKLMEKVKNL